MSLSGTRVAKLRKIKYPSFSTDANLSSKQMGPFNTRSNINDNSFKLDLPVIMHIHPVKSATYVTMYHPSTMYITMATFESQISKVATRSRYQLPEMHHISILLAILVPSSCHVIWNYVTECAWMFTTVSTILNAHMSCTWDTRNKSQLTATLLQHVPRLHIQKAMQIPHVREHVLTLRSHAVNMSQFTQSKIICIYC